MGMKRALGLVEKVLIVGNDCGKTITASRQGLSQQLWVMQCRCC